MNAPDDTPSSLGRVFDELRFGATRTLNLRVQQPTASQATVLAESWLRTQQVQGVAEVLMITGRGNRSVDGVSPVREAVVRLLPSLRRRNVISGFVEHTPGSFVVTLAPVKALFEAPRRRRERGPLVKALVPRSLEGLDGETQNQLRDVAVMSLEALGLRTPTNAQIEDEMLRQFAVLASSIEDNEDREAVLQQALERARGEFDGGG